MQTVLKTNPDWETFILTSQSICCQTNQHENNTNLSFSNSGCKYKMRDLHWTFLEWTNYLFVMTQYNSTWSLGGLKSNGWDSLDNALDRAGTYEACLVRQRSILIMSLDPHVASFILNHTDIYLFPLASNYWVTTCYAEKKTNISIFTLCSNTGQPPHTFSR